MGSERRSGSPLGVAVAQARRLDAEIAAAQFRLASFAGDEERLRGLETEAERSSGEALDAQRAWIRARIARLGDHETEIRLAGDEASSLAAALEAEAPFAGFPVDQEALVIALGGELHQLARAADEAEARWTAAAEPVDAIRRRRAEIITGLRAMPDAAPVAAEAVDEADRLRRRVEVVAAVARRDSELDITSRDEALRREIAVTGLGSVDPGQLGTVSRLVDAAQAGKARARVAFGLLGAITLVGAAAAAGLAAAGDRLAALLAAISALVAVAGLAARRRARAAHREHGETRSRGAAPGTRPQPGRAGEAEVSASSRTQPPP